MKIVSSSQGIHTPEFHKKKKRERRWKIFIISISVVIIIGVPTFLLRLKQFLISNITITGNSVTQSEQIEQIVSQNINQNYLWFIPKSNALIYPKSQIISELKNQIPRLLSVDITLSNPNSMNIKVVERQPVALYCTNFSDPNNPSGCFFLDEDGFVFSEAPSFSGGVYFIFTSDPIFGAPLRLTYLNKQKFNELTGFIKGLANINLYPRIFINKGDEYTLLFASPLRILWKSSDDLSIIRSNLESFLFDSKILKLQKENGPITFIDLRFGIKIRYKF